ncbi:MAG: TspO/MBR family protein [Acidobacteriota bacterium]
MKKYASLIVFLGIVFIAGASGAAFQPGEWYDGLSKPSWNPPSWVFGPVWSVLYVMIAISGWRLWRHREQGTQKALIFWGVNIVLNALWSWLYFGLRRPDLAFAEIVFIWLTIVATIAFAWRPDRSAGLLLVPYLLWVSFAAALNFTLWQMNL